MISIPSSLLSNHHFLILSPPQTHYFFNYCYVSVHIHTYMENNLLLFGFAHVFICLMQRLRIQ